MRLRRGDGPATRLVAGLLLAGSLVLAACDNSAASDGPTASGPSPTASTPERAATGTADPARDAEAAVVAAYLDFWDAVEAAGNPPDPDHPDLAATAGDPQLTQLRDVLSEYREQGYVRRGDHRHHPVVREILTGQDAAIVDDCLEIDPEAGLYDAETGERIEGGDPPGSKELVEARLERIDRAWKVVNVNVVEEDSTCVPVGS